MDNFGEKQHKFKENLRDNFYYYIVFLVSLIILIFFPFIGSEAGLDFNLPTTVAGWLIYVVTKVLIAVLNVIIFFSFMQQAKLNVADDERYKKTLEILGSVKDKQYRPMAPRKWERKQYTHKGITIFISTAVSLVSFSNAFITYDYMSLITYIMVIIMGVVFGLLQMSSAEYYWTHEAYDYAIQLQQEQQNEPKIATETDFHVNYENYIAETQNTDSGQISVQISRKDDDTIGN